MNSVMATSRFSSQSTTDTSPFLSVIVPVYNGGYAFVYCLSALHASHYPNWELIVVDDGSTDQSAIVAEQFGATVLRMRGRLGPGAARNLGAQRAKGDYVCFIDADCEVYPNTLSALAEVIQQHPTVEAFFGSYDDCPKAPNFVAQYKNLFHHYVHQTGQEEATTFWAGCGCVKRSAFLGLGGFDVARFPRPSVEDIDLGYRIKQAGGRILLAKQVQVKHHKAWGFRSLVKTDVCDRAIPWTQLLLSHQSRVTNDLNLQVSHRISVVLAYALVGLLLVGALHHSLVLLLWIPAIALLILNWDIYRFFLKKRGRRFVLGVVAMHWLYYIYGGASFAVGMVLHLKQEWQKSAVTKRSEQTA
jgi:glycosyltransferase involved in cell wall biosynthesis